MKTDIPFLGSGKIKITTKFTVLFILVGLVPLAFSGIISYSIYQKNVEELTLSAAVSSVDIVRSDIEDELGSAERFLKIGETQWPILFFEAAENKYNYAKEILSVYDYYRKGYENNNLIKNIYVIGLNGRCLSERRGVYFNHKSFIGSSRYMSQILENGNEITIIPEHIPNYDKLPSNEIVISMGTVLYNNITFEPAGIVVLDLDPVELEKLYMNFKFIDVGLISLIYSSLPPDNLPWPELGEWDKLKEDLSFRDGYKILPVHREPYLFVNSDTKYVNLRVMGTVPVNELLSGVYRVRTFTIVSLVASIVLILCIYLIISRGLMRPLNIIQAGMHNAADGNLDIEINSFNGNMIPDLYTSFEKMIHDIRNYIIKIDEEHVKYVDAELRVLQAQINPHFLYNTLDTILWSAVAEGNDEIVELVSEMSKFFRLSLSKGADYVSVGDEIACITSYLHIQQIRYRDILEFQIAVEDDILEFKMLKLILQPLVENALYHGIKTKRGKGHILVSVRKKENRLLFKVSDDGAGMSKERLDELNTYLVEPWKHMGVRGVGVGLLNVQNRIMIKYDKSTTLLIESHENEGTSISFSLPVSKL